MGGGGGYFALTRQYHFNGLNTVRLVVVVLAPVALALSMVVLTVVLYVGCFVYRPVGRSAFEAV